MLKASELQKKLLLTPAQLLRLKWPSEELEELRGQLEEVKRWAPGPQRGFKRSLKGSKELKRHDVLSLFQLRIPC